MNTNILILSIAFILTTNISNAQLEAVGKFENGIFEINDYTQKGATSKLKYYKMKTLLKSLKKDSLLMSYAQRVVNEGLIGYGSSLIVFDIKKGRINLVEEESKEWHSDKSLILALKKHLRSHHIINMTKAKSTKFGIIMHFDNVESQLCLELYELKNKSHSLIKRDCTFLHFAEPDIPIKKIEEELKN
jgi:hypothetical protein